MTRIDHGDGEPVRLVPPFEHLSVTYPFAWAQPGRVHLFDDREGTGRVMAPEYARALAEATIQAMGGRVLTLEQAALAASVIEEAFVAEYDRTRLERLHHLAVALGADLPPYESEDQDE